MTRISRIRSIVSAAALAALSTILAAATVLAGSGSGPFPK
jgi:hypothetical protein